MKKHIMLLFALAFIFLACGNQKKNEQSTEMTPEEETAFVEDETEAVDASVNQLKSEVDDSEEKINELLKGI
jgi:uncharacterized protein YlxW (UPF0749 family)